MTYSKEQLEELWTDYRVEYQRWDANALAARRAKVLDAQGELQSYTRRSKTQQDELLRLDAELTVLDSLIADREVSARADRAAQRAIKVEEVRRAAMDPANLERPAGSVPEARPGAPAVVKRLGERPETAAEVIQRAGNPWRAEDGSPLAGHTSYGTGETGQGLISRAHGAIEAFESSFGHDGAESWRRCSPSRTAGRAWWSSGPGKSARMRRGCSWRCRIPTTSKRSGRCSATQWSSPLAGPASRL